MAKIPKIFLDKVKKKHWRLNNLYKIVDKQGQLIKFKFNKEQQKTWNECFDDNGKMTASPDQLKGRQFGMTTFWIIVYFDDCIWNKNLNVFIQSHERESITKIFRIAQTCFRNLHPIFKPVVDRGGGSKHEMYFTQLNSRIYVGLEHRSGSVHRLHLSETAFQDQKKIGATMGALPPNQHYSSETTPNGMNFYQKDWTKKDAKRKKMFFCWLHHEPYSLDGESQLYDSDEIIAEKEWIDEVDKYWKKLPTKGQIEFRRSKIREYFGDIDLFAQEFPSDPITCFLSSGKNFFKKVHRLRTLKSECKKPVETNSNGCVFYEMPVKGEQYLISVDTSEGISTGDYGSIKVFRVRIKEEVMSFRGKLEPAELGDVIWWAAQQFSTGGSYPLVGIERNNHGHAVLLHMRTKPIDYPNLYYYTKGRPGWLTDKITRPMMLDVLKTGILNETVKMNDPIFFDETFTFIEKDGKPQAETGANDDTIFSGAIGVYLMTQISVLITNIEMLDLSKTSISHDLNN